MNTKNIADFKKECTSYLCHKSVEVLRAYGRSIGMQKPTTLNKQDLICAILATICGELPPNRNQKGAPVKNNFLDEHIVDDMERFQEKYGIGTRQNLDTQPPLTAPCKQELAALSPEIVKEVQKESPVTLHLTVDYSNLTDVQKEKLKEFLDCI